jgi:hypothetical protein
MINEEKVKLMTKMASYEAGEGRKYLAVCKYFRSDYISLQILKAIISGTLAFGIVVGMALLYDFDTILKDLYKIDLIQTGKDLAVVYLITVGFYVVLVYFVSVYRYNRARQSLRTYYGNLKKLSKYYE